MFKQTDNQINFSNVLFGLTKMDNREFAPFIEHLLRVVSDALNVERVSLWFYDEDRNSIQCYKLFIRQNSEFESEAKLLIEDYPRYFDSLNKDGIIISPDSQRDSVTEELVDGYLKPLGIISMMDVPIWLRGNMIGILCSEDTLEYHEWDLEEQLFVSSVSDLIALAHERHISQVKEKDLVENQRFLNTLITNLPGYVYQCVNENNKWITKFASVGIYELTGYEREDFLHVSDFSFGHLLLPEEQHSVAKTVQDALDSKKPYQITYRIKTKDNKIKWVWEQGRGIYNEANHLVATEGFITDISEKKMVEEEILKRNEELSILNQIAKSLSKLADKDQILETIQEMTGKLYDSNNMYISLFNAAENTISFPIYMIDGIVTQRHERPFANGITEYVIVSEKPLLIENNIKDTLSNLGIDIMVTNKASKSSLSVPMIIGGRVLGVITLQNHNKEFAFTEKDKELMLNIATQAAIALENARLYQEIQNELKEKQIAEERIKKSLREKEILLQEVHHRVKNNLQIMSSLLRLQSQNITDEDILDMFRESETRVKSMAIVHNKLYNSKDYERIDFGDYIKSLTDNLIGTYAQLCSGIRFNHKMDTVQLNIDTAIPCGLLLNELITNSIKYAFPEKSGEINIILKANNGKYSFTVKDNGIGLPDNYKQLKPDSLGLKLVSLLTEQIGGKIEISNNKGAEFKIEFEEVIYKPRT